MNEFMKNILNQGYSDYMSGKYYNSKFTVKKGSELMYYRDAAKYLEKLGYIEIVEISLLFLEFNITELGIEYCSLNRNS